MATLVLRKKSDLKKPAFGKPCNQCGICCMAEPCLVGAQIFGVEQGRCPALLEDKKGTYACGLVKRPAQYVSPERLENRTAAGLCRSAKLIINIGGGCDSWAFNEKSGLTDDQVKNRELDVANEDITEGSFLKNLFVWFGGLPKESASPYEREHSS